MKRLWRITSSISSTPLFGIFVDGTALLLKLSLGTFEDHVDVLLGLFQCLLIVLQFLFQARLLVLQPLLLLLYPSKDGLLVVLNEPVSETRPLVPEIKERGREGQYRNLWSERRTFCRRPHRHYGDPPAF